MERKENYARVHIRTKISVLESTEDKKKYCTFTLIEFETKNTERLEERINENLKAWIKEAERLFNCKREKTEEERLEEVEQTTDELVELMADVLGGAI